MTLTRNLILVSAALALAGCATPRQNPAYTGSPGSQVISSPKYQAGGPAVYQPANPPQGSSESDRALTERVQQALNNGTTAALAPNVNVSSQNGVVSLTGSVPSDQTRQSVDDVVRNLPGVTSVMDRLQITPAPGTTGQTASQPPAYGTSPASNAATTPALSNDTQLANAIHQQLQNDSSVASFASNIRVSAQQGTVMLSGYVPSDQARQQVDSIVRNVNGVTTVMDQLQVNPPTGRSEQVNRNYSASQPQNNTAPTVPSPAPASPQAGAATGDIFSLHVQGLNETDRSLAERILQGLRTDTTLESMMPRVNINVSGGRVVLQGNVENQQQRQSIVSVVQRAAGSNNVEDQLQVQNQ